MNYAEFKKFSLLRTLLRQGIEVDELFDPEEVDEEIADAKRAKLRKMTTDDILHFFRQKLYTIDKSFSNNSVRNSRKAGSEGAREQKEEWKKIPDVGLSFASNYLTTVTDGMKLERFNITSAGTGVGKTRMTIAHLCHSFVARFWDSKQQKWIKNPNGTQNAALYIGTEMELIEEIEPILWAYIADVPQDHITQGTYEEGEEERVDEAIRILDEESFIFLEYIPDYDVSALRDIVEKHVKENNVHHIFLDYIMTTAELTREYQNTIQAKMVLREDQVLSNFSAKLKDLCREYSIHLESWTQVSGDFKNENNRDQTIVRGAKALVDKADTAAIASLMTKKEEKLLEKFFKLPIMMGKRKPNHKVICLSVYKNRGGKYNRIKIWLGIDYSTMRVHDYFCTDYDLTELCDIQQSFTEVLEDQKINRVHHKNLLSSSTSKVEELETLEEDVENLNQAFSGNDEKILEESKRLTEHPEINVDKLVEVEKKELKEKEKKSTPFDSEEGKTQPKKRGRPKSSKSKKTSKSEKTDATPLLEKFEDDEDEEENLMEDYEEESEPLNFDEF